MNILVLTKRHYTNKDMISERFGRLRELPLELAQRGHQVKGICLSYKNSKEGLFRDGPVEWQSTNIGFFKITGLFRFSASALKLARQSDIVWACSDSIYGIIGYFLSRKTGVPLVFDLYDNFEYFLLARLPFIKQLYRMVIRKSAAITCVSQPLKQLIQTYRSKGNIFVLENSVRKDLFYPRNKKHCRRSLGLPMDKILIGTAGALNTNRGTPFLFEAFNILSKKYPEIHLVLAGSRNLEIPRQSNIHYLGILPLTQIPFLLNALDIAVICNLENEFGKYCFPQKLREIMACDIPLVAARVGIFKNLLKDRSKWLFTPNDPKDMNDAIENRLRDKRTDYGDIPSWTDFAVNLEQVFRKVLNSK